MITRDMAPYMGALRDAAASLDHPFSMLALRPLDQATRLGRLFATMPGAASHHHAYPGGLAVHTAEVVQYAIQLSGPTIDRNVLLLAAVWHDVGKVYENEPRPGGGFRGTRRRDMVGHLVDSTYLFLKEADGLLGPVETEEVLHCMLSHHGRREWGSPVEPAMREAFVLHSADMLSMQQAKREEARWPSS